MVAELEGFALSHPVEVGGREDNDHYPTPAWCTRALLARMYTPGWPVVALDPCAGEGAILDVARERGMRTEGLELDALRSAEARHRGHRVQTGDALALPWPPADYLITNPPYSLAETFIRKALAWQADRPYLTLVTALLRLSWLEPTDSRGSHRRELLLSTTPDVLILPERPKFDGRGQDNITSAWFCWPGKSRWELLP